MKKALQGALWSGLVLPGLGQIVLRRYLRGAMLLLASLACLAVLAVRAVELAHTVIENLDPLHTAIEPGALLAEVRRVARTSADSREGLSLLLTLLWLGGTVDAWLLGRQLDRQERQAPGGS